MNGLSNFLVESILLEADSIDKVVVVYSGRFQPFHKGHYATYDNLVRKFGKDSVYIGTSNVTDSKKSPFNFKEKKAIMTNMFGIPSNKIVNIRNPYAPEEILKKYDEDTTGLIVVVGEKDQNRLSGKYFTAYKGKVTEPYLDRGYVYASPATANPISGTDVRYWLSAGSEAERKKNFTKAYPKFDDQIFKMITLKLKKLKECINEEISLNVKVGDTLLMGKFKNKKVLVKDIGKDEYGMPTINGKKAVTFRIPKKEDLKEMGLGGGAGVGLSLPGGYINGAPKADDVKKVSKKLNNKGMSGYEEVEEVVNSKNHKTETDAEYNFLHHHKTSGYAPDYGHEAELDTIDFDDDRKKEPGHQTNTKDTQNKGYEPVKEIAVQTDRIPGGLAKGKTLVDLSKRWDSKGYYNPTQFAKEYIKPKLLKGIKVEMEHTTDVRIATEIAMDHLWEDINYYEKLASIEKNSIAETSGNGAFYNDGNATSGTMWNAGWDDYDNEGYYLDNLDGWDFFDEIPSEREKKKAIDQTLPIDAHSDVVDKYNRIRKYGFKPPADLNESLLTEGGAYGHMNHPFDIEMNLTFSDLKNIVSKALNGDLETAREKTDGQALAISWVNGRLVAARNKSHLKNGGVGAMTIGQVADKFAGRGGLTDAYNFAMQDLSKAISGLSEAQRKMVFKNGTCFMNLEVIYPTSVNVIPYGQPLLVFHGTFEYDKEGNVVGENQQAARVLAGMIKQVNAHVQSKYTIQGPPMQSLPKSDDLSSRQGKYFSMISKLQSEFGLKDSDGVADYHQAWWTNFVDKNAKKLDAQQKIGLVKRWAFGNKSFRIADIKDDKLRAWAEQIDKQDQQKISKQNLMRFEEIFLGVGADVLSFMTSVLTANPDSAKKQMVSRLQSTISQVKASGDPKKIAKLKLELQRLNALGGFDKIVPNEGIVFVYGGNTYKLTGAFAPLNQILGIFFDK
jgi:hypothetical protein